MRLAAESRTVRERLISAATRLFAERGFEATPIQAIADEVGVTKPALLHHFPSKEHLRTEVLTRILSYWNDALPRLLLAATASDERFDAIFSEVYGFFSKEPDRARFIAREALDRPTETRKLLRHIRPIAGAVSSYIREGTGCAASTLSSLYDFFGVEADAGLRFRCGWCQRGSAVDHDVRPQRKYAAWHESTKS